MRELSKSVVVQLLLDSGFIRSVCLSDVYLLRPGEFMNGAFSLRIIRKRGMLRLSGSLGIYCGSFETTFREKYKISGDNLLPLQIAIENFVELNHVGAFEYTDDPEKLSIILKHILNIITRFPTNIEQLRHAVSIRKIGDLPVSAFLGPLAYFERGKLFTKSVLFINWLREIDESLLLAILNCLDGREAAKIGNIIKSGNFAEFWD